MNPSPALLDEYGLNQVTYGLLRAIERAGPIHWDRHKNLLASFTGNPAPSLRKLVDRGLITGPGRNEPIRARPFEVTDRGRDILSRLERGLRTPAYISASRLAALRLLATGYATDRQLLDASHRMSIISLKDAKYIEWNNDAWHITILGREALAEYQNLHANLKFPEVQHD